VNERTHIDLFSGIGGFALAAQANGLRTVAFCERDEWCQRLLAKRFGAVADCEEHRKGRVRAGRRDARGGGSVAQTRPVCYPDIHTFDGTAYAGAYLLTGGFPCQPYSCAGKRGGDSDDRALWPQMARVIAEARPDFVLGENVSGIVSMALDGVLSDLERLGYTCWPVVIPACAVDAKHRRDRVWIVARRDDADAQGIGLQGQRAGGQQVAQAHGGTRLLVRPGADDDKQLLHTPGPRLPDWAGGEVGQPWPVTQLERSGGESDDTQREVERYFRRMVDGLPDWLDRPVRDRCNRLRGLGNAIVPQVATALIAMMIRSEQCEA